MKMRWFSEQDNPLSFAKPLKGEYAGLHRFRVGNYRVFVELLHHDLYILAIHHRREAYQM